MDKLTSELHSPDPEVRLQAISEAAQQPANLDLLTTMERLAASDPQATVRAAALNALESPNLHGLRLQRLMKLDLKSQRFILKELQEWQTEGLIEEDQAQALRSRYLMKAKPAPLTAAQTGLAPGPNLPAVPPAESGPQPASAKSASSLAQIFLSETSVRTFLYLGAFFVVAAAAILAALVETLRLPILSMTALVFGGSALALKKRLPQPSFVLFVVFSFILLIHASVFANMLDMKSQTLAGYWVFILLVHSGFSIFGIRFYNSRFFSVLALTAFLAGALNLPAVFHPRPGLEEHLLAAQLANLAALGGLTLLIRKQGWAFGKPTFTFSQIVNLMLLLAIGLASLLIQLFTAELRSAGPALALSALLGALYYATSHQLKPFALFPWMAAAALAPVVLLVQPTLEPPQQDWLRGVGFTGWGFILLLLGEAAHRLNKFKRFHEKAGPYDLPLSAAGSLLLLLGGAWGMFVSTPWGVGLFSVAFVGLAGLHLLRRRGWLWFASLLAGLAAYFLFFELPFLPELSEYAAYKLAAIAIVLLLPDLILRPNWKENQTWFLPPRLLAILMGSAALLSILIVGLEDPLQAGLAAGLLAIPYWLYAIRYDKAWLAYLPGLLLALGLAFGSQEVANRINLQTGLAALSLLALLYSLSGWSLAVFFKQQDWSRSLRWTGLMMVPFLLAAILAGDHPFEAGWVMLYGLIFLAEARQSPYLEIIAPILLSIGWGLALAENNITELFYALGGFSLVWLGCDLLYQRLLPARPLRAATWIGLGLALVASASDFLVPVEPVSAGMFAVSLGLAAATLAYALLRSSPRLGYIFVVFLTLATLTGTRVWAAAAWPWTLMALSGGFYLAGAARARWSKGWSQVLRFGALGLGTLTSLGTLTQAPSLGASVPIAIAASLWASEAFRRRNVWLGFPANGLYLMSYFTLLSALEVTQPQFYSLGAALLGLLMHYLLARAGSDTGAFVTGLISQLLLLGTTYFQMLATNELGYFAALFFQALVVLIYGLVLRSRSLVGVPVVMLVLGVSTVVLFILRGLSTVILIGCTGIVMLVAAILAVVLRERLSQVGERLSSWRA
ncbi:MAG: hypothetical protein RBS68_06490 [Anaerolineales bacterium]|jgi:hypothetical protein|nr:hypothetical protein [Anaerolineales bacterium]